MITSDIQLKVTKKKISRLQESLNTEENKKVKDVFRKAAKAQTMNLINELKKEIKDYEELKSNGPDFITVHDDNDLFLLPLKYRLAKGLSRAEFAALVQVGERQIARYEADLYQNINVRTFRLIMSHLPFDYKRLKFGDDAKRA